ncbi:MAG: UDP-N-acetylglucosamine 1-carboxyvinyltransferase [Balneolales bacterium]
MDKFIIQGNTPLQGNLHISGSKNAALPLIAASLLADDKVTIDNIPGLNDILTFNNVLRVTGARVDYDEHNHSLTVDPKHISFLEAPYDLVRKMRASFYMLGALLGRFGKAKVSLPGGCAWGPRPVDLHLEGLKALGAEIKMEGGYVIAKARNGRLDGGSFTLKPSSVGATVNILLGAVLAKGDSIIDNAAREPDVVYLCEALNQMGAKISGAGTSRLTVQGVDNLSGSTLRNSPDRIEAGTYMIAAIMHPESNLTLTNLRSSDLGSFIKTFRKLDIGLQVGEEEITIQAPEKINPLSVTTEIYPGFPTDLQAQWATMMTQAEGSCKVKDKIYTDRFSYVPELVRLGADLKLKGNTVDITGKTPLKGASIMSTDLRASVSLVLAAMIADGQSEVLRVYHLDRGYEKLEEKLNAVGAKIERVSTV